MQRLEKCRNAVRADASSLYAIHYVVVRSAALSSKLILLPLRAELPVGYSSASVLSAAVLFAAAAAATTAVYVCTSMRKGRLQLQLLRPP
jgi:hypothetical protein